jgi:2-methylcitrate dehydratase PrpD
MASMTELITPKQQAETHSAVERIGAFAVAARPEHLTTDIRQLYKRNILDSTGCAIAAVAGSALRTLRDQIEEYRAPGRCTLIGGGKTSPDQAALFNSLGMNIGNVSRGTLRSEILMDEFSDNHMF